MPRPVIIMDYDPHWPILYEEEKRRILKSIGHKASTIEHIGSTAVPGLGGKPIIDIVAGVHNSADAEECVPLLQKKQLQSVKTSAISSNSFWLSIDRSIQSSNQTDTHTVHQQPHRTLDGRDGEDG